MTDFLEVLRFSLNEHGYILLENIGEGGFSSVFKVESVKYKSFFVAKIIRDFKDDNMHEANVLIELSHPYIINVYDYWVHNKFGFLIIDYCSGGSVEEYIKKNPIISENTAIRWMKQILQAVQYCHSNGVAHLDIKPRNIMIDEYGRIKLIDFGNSCKIEDNGRIAHFSCTQCMASPEIDGFVPFFPIEADIWAIGITFFYIFTGSYPWDKPPKQNVELEFIKSMSFNAAKIPKAFCPILKDIIKENPKSRKSINAILENPVFLITETKSLLSHNSIVSIPTVYKNGIRRPNSTHSSRSLTNRTPSPKTIIQNLRQ